MIDKTATRLFAVSAIVIALGMLTLWLHEGSSSEYWAAVKWYAGDQIADNPLLRPLTILAAIALVGWSAIAARDWWAASRGARGELPLRQLGVVAEDTLVRRARALLSPTLSRPLPRVERVLDALLGTTVDLGASQVRLQPAGDHVDVVLVVGMDRLPVTRITWSTHETLVRRLAVMLALDGTEGRGLLKLRSGESVDQFDVVLRQRDSRTEVKLQLASRARAALTLPGLGLAEEALEQLRERLRASKGLIVICAAPRHGATTTLYAAGHYAHQIRGARTGQVALLEPHVSLGVPFMHQAEVGGRASAAVLRTLLRRSFAVLMVRSVADANTARLAVGAARDRCVVLSLEVDDIAEGLYRLTQWVGADVLEQTLTLALGQRLLPRLCPQCRVRGGLTERQHGLIGQLDLPSELYHPAGGECCNGRGQRGLQPLFWLWEPQRQLFERLKSVSDASMLRRDARSGGARCALDEALVLAVQGDISAEVLVELVQREMC
jgi:type II secretory ATPase GspE/PulE/Tfp pilus assembly ATPase PilB-like protein